MATSTKKSAAKKKAKKKSAAKKKSTATKAKRPSKKPAAKKAPARKRVGRKTSSLLEKVEGIEPVERKPILSRDTAERAPREPEGKLDYIAAYTS